MEGPPGSGPQGPVRVKGGQETFEQSSPRNDKVGSARGWGLARSLYTPYPPHSLRVLASRSASHNSARPSGAPSLEGRSQTPLQG